MSASLYQRCERHAPAPHTRFLITPDGAETSHCELSAGVRPVGRRALRTAKTLAEDAIVGVPESALTKVKLAKRVLIVDSLPRNTMDKVRKAAPRETYKALFLQVA